MVSRKKDVDRPLAKTRATAKKKPVKPAEVAAAAVKPSVPAEVVPVVAEEPSARVTEAPSAAPVASAELVEVKDVGGDVRERVRQEAFNLWRERGGDAMENWLEAERRVHAHH